MKTVSSVCGVGVGGEKRTDDQPRHKYFELPCRFRVMSLLSDTGRPAQRCQTPPGGPESLGAVDCNASKMGPLRDDKEVARENYRASSFLLSLDRADC